jgi:hypothetical protein
MDVGQSNQHPRMRGVVIRDVEGAGIGLHSHCTLGGFDSYDDRVAVLVQADE